MMEKEKLETKKTDYDYRTARHQFLLLTTMMKNSSFSVLISSSTYMDRLLSNETIENISENSYQYINNILFLITLFISIPSVFINLFAIYQLHGNTKLSVFVFRTILHLSLFTTCTCIPFFLLELYYNTYFPLSPLICKLWLIIDYSSIVTLGLLVCWASIQRHILIFGPIHIKKLQSTLKFKLIPIILVLGFPLIWYSLLASTCTYEIKFHNVYQCRPCFENDKSIFLIDTILSLILPLFITLLVTFCLLIRIIRLRFKILRLTSKKWRRCKRLTRQLILFSFIYLIGLVPYVLTNLNSLYNFWPSINLPWCIQLSDAFTYVPCCFSPFLSIYAFPEIWTNHRTHYHHHHHRHHRHRKINRQYQTVSVDTPTMLSPPIDLSQI